MRGKGQNLTQNRSYLIVAGNVPHHGWKMCAAAATSPPAGTWPHPPRARRHTDRQLARRLGWIGPGSAECPSNRWSMGKNVEVLQRKILKCLRWSTHPANRFRLGELLVGHFRELIRDFHWSCMVKDFFTALRFEEEHGKWLTPWVRIGLRPVAK